jgi:hypothetical protein
MCRWDANAADERRFDSMRFETASRFRACHLGGSWAQVTTTPLTLAADDRSIQRLHFEGGSLESVEVWPEPTSVSGSTVKNAGAGAGGAGLIHSAARLTNLEGKSCP